MLFASCSGGSSSNPQIPEDIAEESDIASDDADTERKPSGAAYLEIAELSDSEPDCSKTTPGPDIDAAVLYSDPSKSKIIATLDGCKWLKKEQACDKNSKQSASAANGEETDSPVAGFVSLNGGSIICGWSNGTQLMLGNLVQVFEVGAKDEAEPFQIRACQDSDATTCGKYITVDRDKVTVPAGKILPEN